MPFGLGVGELLMMIPWLMFWMLLILWPWALYECLMKESSEGNTKIAWGLAILLVPVLGAPIYLLFRRPQRIHELGE